LKSIYGTRVLGIAFRTRRENNVILPSFLVFDFSVNFLIFVFLLVNYLVFGYWKKMIKLSQEKPILIFGQSRRYITVCLLS